MKLFCCLILVASFHNLALASKCVQSQSKNCVVLSVTSPDDSSNEATLPDLYGKTSLQIKGGSLTTFGEKLSNQLKSVQKLQLGQLGLQELFLNAELLDVTATDNQIHAVKFKSTDGNFKLQKLDLQRNRLKHLSGFEVLTNLLELHLEDNQLESLDFDVFEQMRHLKELHLDRNQLSTVVATSSIDLPALDYLSMAGNRLTKLDVSSWNFASLTKWDVSSNELIYVDGIDIDKQFPSLQTIFLAKNGWHCKWLNNSLDMFQLNSVTVGDQDEGAECDKHGGICCVSVEVLVDTGLDRLESMTKDQENLRKELEKNLEDMEVYQDDQLENLRNLLKDLQEKSKMPLTAPSEPFNMEELAMLRNRTEQLKSLLQKELQTSKQQKQASEKSVKNLEYTILQLRKSLQHEVGKISGLQKQFKLLRETTNKQN